MSEIKRSRVGIRVCESVLGGLLFTACTTAPQEDVPAPTITTLSPSTTEKSPQASMICNSEPGTDVPVASMLRNEDIRTVASDLHAHDPNIDDARVRAGSVGVATCPDHVFSKQDILSRDTFAFIAVKGLAPLCEVIGLASPADPNTTIAPGPAEPSTHTIAVCPGEAQPQPAPTSTHI